MKPLTASISFKSTLESRTLRNLPTFSIVASLNPLFFRFQRTRRISEEIWWVSVRNGWCVGRNPSFVLGSIRLSGLPAPPAAVHRRLFALAPRGTAVSPRPPASSSSAESSSPHRWTSRFCSVAGTLAPRLTASRCCLVDGVSSAPIQGPSAARRLTNQ